MAKQTISLGTTDNDGTGTDAKAAGAIINENFTELYDTDAVQAAAILALQKAVASPVTIAPGTSRALGESDFGKMLIVNAATAVNLTIDPALTQGGFIYLFASDLTAAATLLEGAGVTLVGTAALRKTGCIYSLWHSPTLNTWHIFGNELLPAGDLPAEALRRDVTNALVAGFTNASFDAGTKSTGTFNPALASGNLQHCINGGAFALGLPTGTGPLVLEMVNDANAGAVDLSAFGTLVTGDALTTTNGDKFILQFMKTNTLTFLNIIAAQ